MKATLPLFLLLTILLAGCGSLAKLSKRNSVAEALPLRVSNLTVEQQRKYDYFFLEATRLKEKEEYDAAFNLYEHCLAIDPQAASSLYEISQFYMFLKQVPQGQAALEQAVSVAPDNFWYSQALSNLYQQQNQQLKAIDLLEEMVVHFPTKQEPLFSLIELYNQIQNYPQVIVTLDRLEERMGKNEQLTMEKFRIYLEMKESAKAFKEIESLIREYPSDLRYQVVLGDVYLQNGKEEEALDLYQKALTIEPDHAQALFSLASYYDQTGQSELYEQQINLLLLSKKVPSDMKLNVVRQFILRNEQEKRDSTYVISLFDRMLSVDLEDDQIRMLYAQYLQAKGMEAASLSILEQVMHIDPTNKAARITLLGAAIRKEDYKEVIRICEPGIEATPDAIEFYFYLAIAYNQAERLEDVLRVSRKALEVVKPETSKEIVSDFYTLMADIYYQQKLNEQAYAAYDSALIYNPSNIGALNNYAYYLSVQGHDLDKAEEMSYKTVKAEPNNATYLDTYAWILFEKGNYVEARIYIDSAMKSDEEQGSVVTEHCGDIYFMSGDVEGALKYWKEALKKGSESKVLKRKIETKKHIAE